MNVYLLWHTHMRVDDEEDVKLLGVYSSEAKALARAEAAKQLDGFGVSPYDIDHDEWTDGFVTVTWRE